VNLLLGAFYAATGGRPMRLLMPAYFTDPVTRKPVHLYADAFGRVWMARSRWAYLRAPSQLWPTLPALRFPGRGFMSKSAAKSSPRQSFTQAITSTSHS
jgi:hypothetical protein